MSLADVASATGISKPKLGQLERGTYNVGPDELEQILSACRASDADIARLKTHATRPRGRPWWYRWASVVPDWFGLYLGLEGMARSMFVYEPSVVHGLVQTRGYATAVTSVASLVRPADVSRQVELRMQRSQRLVEQNPLEYTLILEEGALRRMPPEPMTMREQLDHLLLMGCRANVQIRVLPTDRALHAGMTVGQFALFDMGDLGTVAHAETFGDASYIRDIDKLESYCDAARYLSDEALTVAETKGLIAEMGKAI